MELVIDLKIEVKSNSYRNVITDFGYFKKITGESNQNIAYIRNASKAEFSIKPCFTGINDGLTITLKHNTLDGVDNAKRLLLSLIDTMKDDFEVFKMNRGIPMDAVRVLVELNLAVCYETGFMSTSFDEFEDHVRRNHGSGKRPQQNRTPWGKPSTANRDSGSFGRSAMSRNGAQQRGGGDATDGGSYNLRSGDGGNYGLRSGNQRTSTYQTKAAATRSTYQTKSAPISRGTYNQEEKPSAFGAARRATTGTGGPAASTRANFGMAAARTGFGMAAARTGFGIAAKRSTLGFAASKYAPLSTRRTSAFTLAAKRSAVGRPAASTRQTTTSTTFQSPRSTTVFGSSTAVGNKRGTSMTEDTGPNKRAKMSRFDFGNGSGATAAAAGRTVAGGVKRKTTGVPREQTLLARRLRNDLSDAETKVAIQQLKNKLTQQEVRDLYQSVGMAQKRQRLPTVADYLTFQLKVLAGALKKKTEGTSLSAASKPKAATMSSAKKMQAADRAPPDPERMVTVRLSLEALLRRRNANVLSDQAADAMCRKLMEAAVPKGKPEMVLRQSWESLIERKRFENRREPKRGDKVTIMLTTVVNYIKQEVQDRNVNNSTMEAIMDVLKPQPKPTDPEEPSHNIPIFPVLEKPHATERSIDTRLHWMIAEISFILNKRRTGQMPDQEVNMMIARIKNGVPSVYYDVVNKRFEETARDIEKMANRRMSGARKLTCQLQVICTYARHYLMDKLPGGSPLDPALHRNPFQYIDYDINTKPQADKPQAKGVKPLMGMKLQGSDRGVAPGMAAGKITDIPSLFGTMDKAAAQDERQRILEVREYAKEARIGADSMGIRRVEKIEGDLLKKMPNRFQAEFQQHKKQVANTKGRNLTARERLELTIKWTLANIHASEADTPRSPTATKKTSMPPIIRMRGAEVLKRQGMMLWRKFKTGKPMLTEINKQLTALRDRLTRNEGDIIKSTYNQEIQKLSKTYKVTRLPDSIAAAAKFEATFKYVMGDDDSIAKDSIARDAARKFYETLNNKQQSPVKKSANGKQQKNDNNDDIMIIDDPGKSTMSRDQRVTILRNKFNTIARQFRGGQITVDRVAEIVALAKTNLYLSCDDEDELFVEVRCAWEDRGGDDLTEKQKLTIELELTAKRILAKLEELIDTEGDITVADVRERLGATMSGRMIDV